VVGVVAIISTVYMDDLLSVRFVLLLLIVEIKKIVYDKTKNNFFKHGKK
jgi:hypothetical protein